MCVQYTVSCETIHTRFPTIQYEVSYVCTYVRIYLYQEYKSLIQNSTHFYIRNSGTVGNAGKTKGILIHCSDFTHLSKAVHMHVHTYEHMSDSNSP